MEPFAAGQVAHTLVSGEGLNPVIVLDELDKAGGDSPLRPDGPLYELLEYDTARRFRDEYVDIEIDASHILWVTTANDDRNISEPILNRMNVYSVPKAGYRRIYAIACRLYRELVGLHDWGFADEPPDVMERLSALPPREQRRAPSGRVRQCQASGSRRAPGGRSRRLAFVAQTQDWILSTRALKAFRCSPAAPARRAIEVSHESRKSWVLFGIGTRARVM